MTAPARSARAVALAAALAAALLGPAPARAAAPTPLPATLSARQGTLLATLDLASAFTPELEKRLGNGLTNVVAVFVSVVPEEGGEPVVVTGRVLEVLYDVWEERYAVTIRDARLQRLVRRSAADWGALGALLAEARDLELGPVAALPAAFRVEVRIEVNPVSRELMQRTRELLANPAAGRPGGGSRSVFGAVASYLLREPDAGEEVRLLRSRHFSRGEVVRP